MNSTTAGCLIHLALFLLVWIPLERWLRSLPPGDSNQIRLACGVGAALGIGGPLAWFWLKGRGARG